MRGVKRGGYPRNIGLRVRRARRVLRLRRAREVLWVGRRVLWVGKELIQVLWEGKELVCYQLNNLISVLPIENNLIVIKLQLLGKNNLIRAYYRIRALLAENNLIRVLSAKNNLIQILKLIRVYFLLIRVYLLPKKNQFANCRMFNEVLTVKMLARKS